MTRHDALVQMAMILLRARGEWKGADTSPDHLLLAMTRCSALMPDDTPAARAAAAEELARHARDDAPTPSTGQWPERKPRST